MGLRSALRGGPRPGAAAPQKRPLMTDNTDNLVLVILQDLQAKFSRFEDRMSNLELRFTSFEHQIDLVNSRLSGVQDRLDGFQKQLAHIHRRLELRDPEVAKGEQP
jgi:uncharacterized coiled-coil protein SlyX